MPRSRSVITNRMIADYCRKRLAPNAPPSEVEMFRRYLADCLEFGREPPRGAKAYDWSAIADELGIESRLVTELRIELVPIFDAVTRSVRQSGKHLKPARHAKADRPAVIRTSAVRGATKPSPEPTPKRKYTRKPIVEFPEPLWTEWTDPDSFADALALHLRRHGETITTIYRAVSLPDRLANLRTMRCWLDGGLAPRSVESLELLSRIERRYRLPAGYFKARLGHASRALRGHALDQFTPSERRRLAWHLPDDFNSRTPEMQEEILGWVNRVIITGSTDYRAFQAAAMRNKYAVRFRSLQEVRSRTSQSLGMDDVELETECAVVDAPDALEAEMSALLRFKTSTLTQFGFQRTGVWGTETASQKIEHFGLMFGAFAAHPNSPVRGHGVPLADLTMAMLVFPSVWDWYLQWREGRRGFYTKWEVDMLSIVIAFVKAETGWMRQTPSLADRLRPIPGLVDEGAIAEARANWNAACDAMHKHGRQRIKEIQRVARVHRDPFEPIMPILEADSPVGEYRKITEEIIRTMPDERQYPRAAAEAIRSFLMLRIGLHTGLRQKNLREMRLCPRDRVHTSERQLEDIKCGELRWSTRDHGWEVLIPSVAFKNATSSFFGQKPFRLILPDLAGLYDAIDAYITRHRARLLGPASDPGTFFIKTVKQSSATAAYNQNTFYEAWKLTIQRYGIYNPYTGRGVIPGLLPHGPHNVRDVLATHILKKTGSYEQASYAIQDTPEMVAHHYGRFLPQDKAAIAAQVLNRVWDAA